MVEDEPQPQTLDRNSRNTCVMSRLKDSILSQLDPSGSPSLYTADHSSFLQSRLQHLFQSFHTPTHPPYALMIRRAITELNDGSGLTEEAISEFIRKEYEDLPWAHTKILDVHLKKLCQVEDLSFTEDGRYALPVDDGEGTQQKCKGGRKRKTDHGNGDGERTGTVESVEIREQFQKESNIDCGQGYIISTTGPGIEVSSPTQLQLQISSDIIDLGGVSKMKVSLTCESVDDDGDDDELPQHYNQGNPEGSLDENPMPRRLKQKIPKGPRGRPRKSKTVANSQEESSFNKQKSIANNTVKQGRGRPRKVNHDTEQCREQSQPVDQAKSSAGNRGHARGRGRGRGRGGGRGRGRGRGECVNQDTEQCEEESHPEDQAKPHGGGRGESVNQDTEQCKEESHPGDQAKPHGGGRGEGVNQDTEQCKEESHPEDQAKPGGGGRGEGVNQDTEECEEQSHSEDQGGEGVDQNTEQCEEQSHPEDQAKPSGRGRGGGRARGGGRGRSGSRGWGRPAVRKGLLK